MQGVFLTGCAFMHFNSCKLSSNENCKVHCITVKWRTSSQSILCSIECKQASRSSFIIGTSGHETEKEDSWKRNW